MSYIRLQNSAGKRIDLNLIDQLSETINSENIVVNLPGQKSEKSVILNLNGVNKTISFDFKLIEDGTDRSNGENIITVKQQSNYLKNTIFTGNIDEVYSLSMNTDMYEFDVQCLINEISLRPRKNAPTYIEGTIRVVEGANPLTVWDL